MPKDPINVEAADFSFSDEEKLLWNNRVENNLDGIFLDSSVNNSISNNTVENNFSVGI